VTIGEWLREQRAPASSEEEQTSEPKPRVIFRGEPSFNHSLAEIMLELVSEGINCFETRWFFYDRDHCTDDVMEQYTFFVVHKRVIVREQVSFCDYSRSGFDPTIFQARDDSQPIWFNHPEFDAAWDRYFYQKFYTETFIGQMMVLRPDEPVLYYYARPSLSQLTEAASLAVKTKTYLLLWVLIPLLAAIAFPSIHDLMMFAAIACFAQWGIACWQLRKVGKQS
jgi:hypothetical protein